LIFLFLLIAVYIQFGCFLAKFCQTDTGKSARLFADPLNHIGQLWAECFPENTEKINPVNIFYIFFIFIN